MRKIFVLAIGDRSRASSRLRVWDHLSWLQSQPELVVNADYVVPAGYTRLDAALLWRMVKMLPAWIARFFKADSVYIQESLMLAPLVLLKNLGKRRTIVFDFSDPVDLAGASYLRPLRRLLFNMMVKTADHVIVENCAYAEDFKAVGVPVSHFYGPVDVRRYRDATLSGGQRIADAPLNIGWTGSPSTLGFIEHLFPLLDDIARTRAIRLTLLGVESVGYDFQNLDVITKAWNEEREFQMVPDFDLGLFCLDNTERSLRRGAGKLFIYMAASVPFIASARGIANDLINGSRVGFPVVTDESWEEALLNAIDNAEKRRHYSVAGLAFAEDQLSYEKFRTVLERHLLAA